MKKWLLLFFSALLLSGCGINNNQSQDQQDQQNAINVKNSTIQEVDRETGQQVSRHLVDLATRIPNVNDATAVVLGRFAIVGIDVNKNLDRSEVGTIKYSVAESLKNDPHGARAMIVADPDINARLREIAEDIQNGEPIQGIMNELADIAGRLMPEVPADLVDPNKKNEKNATEDPKKKLNNNQEKQLEQKQEEGSNHYK
ncbi:YhcN/YlaJ family sporulation lipoprotein [Cytobacillus oceanisediminis]|uniref:YhcN/YlaJ family sporulation lipoprotein n=1 Tax=Cytobacillus oceanisediminis TaxID=665099 RepID=A0A562JW40_9BACI|nr:YhcN/YlaJ family sporulation lipoprotein [Cytobacillus oceanisediminis]TWH87195.1 YhcN/YlaJ family sporulation lipoprotein [Cytobacillus oceanisediminis]